MCRAYILRKRVPARCCRLLAVQILLPLQEKGVLLQVSFFQGIVAGIAKRNSLFRIVVGRKKRFTGRILVGHMRVSGDERRFVRALARVCAHGTPLRGRYLCRSRRLSTAGRKLDGANGNKERDEKSSFQHGGLPPSGI